MRGPGVSPGTTAHLEERSPRPAAPQPRFLRLLQTCWEELNVPTWPGRLREFFSLITRNLWLAYLLAAILILCGFHWGLPGPYETQSFQADENGAVWAVNQIHFPGFNPSWYAWGTALFYQVYLVKLLFTAGGFLHASDYWVLVMGRLVVFASALGAITAVFLLGRKLFDPWTGRLAALILAVLPGFVINGHYFKTDVPMTFWMLLTMLAAYQLIDTGNPRYVLLMGLLVGYTATVKYSGGVLFIVGCVALAVARRTFRHRFSWISYLGCTGLGFIVGEHAVLLPWHWGTILASLRWVGHLNRQGVPYYLGRPPAWLDYPLNVMPYSMTAPMLLAAAAALVWVLLRKRARFLPILVFLLAYYPFLAMDNWRLVRYTVPLLPLGALFIAALIRNLRGRRLLGRISLAAGCTLIVYAFLFSFSYVRVMAQVDPRIQATEWIKDHLPNEQPIPAVPAWDLDTAQLQMIGYRKLDVGFRIPDLEKAASPYLIFSEWGTSFYLQAINHYPQQKQFLAYVRENYTEVTHFENSQKLAFVNSKRGSHLPQDWLHPNPRITILVRRNADSTARRTYPGDFGR